MPKPTPKSEMDKAFEELFGPYDADKNIFAQAEKKITEGLAKKDKCHCGVHRKSELVRRMKKLPGIREKTLSDLFDELFNE